MRHCPLLQDGDFSDMEEATDAPECVITTSEGRTVLQAFDYEVDLPDCSDGWKCYRDGTSGDWIVATGKNEKQRWVKQLVLLKRARPLHVAANPGEPGTAAGSPMPTAPVPPPPAPKSPEQAPKATLPEAAVPAVAPTDVTPPKAAAENPETVPAVPAASVAEPKAADTGGPKSTLAKRAAKVSPPPPPKGKGV